MIIADTSGLLAYFNRGEPAHESVSRVVEAEDEPLVISPYVLAELDYLVATRHGVDAELTVLTEMAGGGWLLPSLEAEELTKSTGVIERYRVQGIGLADASLVVLANRFGSRRILTLDHRHFDIIRPIGGGRFSLLP